jgi:hypothetical protein
MTRFLAETVKENSEEKSEGDDPAAAPQEKRGYVTMSGNAQTKFLALHTPGYIVAKQTVLTDIFEMTNFKPVCRLNKGDQVRAIGFPRKEAISGLVRVKAITVGNQKAGDNGEFVGYVTVEGNQNSVYLQPSDKLVFPDDLEQEQKEKEALEQIKQEEEAAQASGAGTKDEVASGGEKA